MRLVFASLIALLLLAEPASRVKPGFDYIQAAHLRADLTFLASDALEGRRSLQNGDQVAVQWIASEFAKAGLKPAAGDSYLQTVPLIEYTPDRTETSMVLRHGGESESYRAPDAMCNCPNEVTVAGPVVFAGYGITAPELNFDDYAGIDAKGKIVLIFGREPQDTDPNSIFNGTGNTRYANATYKAMNAARHGAIGVITANTQAATGQGGGRGGRGQQQGPVIPAEALAEGGAGIPSFTVSSKVTERLFTLAGKSPATVQAVINAKPSPASFDVPGAQVELHPMVAERRRANSYNVAGLLEGSDPTLKAETIVFSGHHDHNGLGPAGIYHGADDNGSGTVGVVELAHAFAMNPAKPKRSLLFIVFAAEERGLLGSYYYVSRPLRPIETTRAEINFDMIGRNEAPTSNPLQQANISPDTSNELGLIGTHYSPDYRAAVERANEQVGLKLNYKWDFDSAQQVLFRSDQYPFLLRDVPAVWWFTGFHPDYHQVTDTVEKINFEKMTKILKLAYLTGFDFADAARTPRLEPRAKAVK